MNIIIVGCGKVGYALAEQLHEEGHSITMVDRRPEKLDSVLSVLDVQGIEGNGTTFKTLSEAGIKDADLLIAVTGKDEVNLLCCTIAKKFGTVKTIARVRNPEYFDEIKYLQREFDLFMVINPEYNCAVTIAKLLEVPSALDRYSFAKEHVDLLKLPIPEDSVLHEMSVQQFATTVSNNTLICIIKRGHEIIIPDGTTIMQGGDNMYVISSPTEIRDLLSKIGIRVKPVKSVMLIGGGTIAYYLAKRLEKSKIKVKIVESDFDRCEELSILLPKTMIIHGDATDRQLLLEEGIDEVDAFVSLTDLDEENLVLSLFAKKVSDAKIVTKVDTVSFEEVIDELAIGTIASPKNMTAKSIIQQVRALKNSMGSNVETMYRMVDNKVEALEFKIRQESKLTNVPISDLKLKKDMLICSIFRNGKMITPSGKDEIHVDDTVIVVTTNKGLTDIKDIVL